MDFELSDEQRLIRETARSFCDAEIAPYAAEWDRAEAVDRAIVGKLASLGFLAAALPEEHGGLGLDMVSYTLLVEELGRADSNVRGIVSVSNGLYGTSVARWGTAEQRARLLPPLAAGEELGCYALTEPSAGSDPGSLETRAERDGDAYVLRGQKVFITLGSWATWALLFARTGEPGPRGITCFVVPTSAEGFEARPINGKLGLRAQDTAELHLDGVRVGADSVLGEVGGGFKVAMSALDHGRISLGAGCVGIAQGCLDAAVAYTTERKQFGRSVASFQLVQELLADIAVETEAARLLVWRAAATADRGERYTVEASYGKYFASEVAVRAANAALQAHGGYGYVDEYPVGKYLRDARVTTLYEGTSQIQKLLIGRALTGENAFA
jgi:alkylation response protein AidB-like acyl-CoA dehydrogenase